MTKKKKLELVLLACISISICLASSSSPPTVDSKSDGLGEWQLLTKLNFSSQIRLHPHILLFVTLPWSGESRSLKREVSSMVTNRQEWFNSLKLMFMYRNTEKMLADAIGAMADEITILYYHNSVSYKYRGRLRAQNILFSIYQFVSVFPGEIPLKSLSNPVELKTFLDSTDKALLLLEFCGWTPKLLAKGRKNVTENGFGGQGLILETDFRGETNRRLTPMGKNIQKEMENANMMCSVDDDISRVPWLVNLSSVNGSAPFKDYNTMPGVLSSCTSEGYQQFESFFLKFMTVAKDFFLPSERYRYGLVSERSMLSTLGIGESGSWLAVLNHAGCPSCVKIIEKEDDLSDVLHKDAAIVSELEGDGRALEPVLPANGPSILLFVDRSCNSLETRSKSKDALDAFRDLAFHIHDSYQLGGQNGDKPENLFQYHQATRSTFGPPRLKLSRTAQLMKLREKMSTIMIVNEGKPVALDNENSDLQGNSLREILARLLQPKKESKLSSLAKELGFQLLSHVIDIKQVNTKPSITETENNPASPIKETEDLVSSYVDSDNDQSPHSTSIADKELPVTSEVTDAQHNSQYDEEKKTYLETNEQLSVESEKLIPDHKLDVDGGVNIADTSSLQVDNSERQQLKFPGFKGSFFFSDGNFRLLRALTGGSKIPSLVIVDPSIEQHYVFPEENDLNYSSMADFLTRFLNGSLLPYRQSESVLHSPREAMQPPFVNMDFHEVDSIPRVTSNTFSELVRGCNQSDSDAWNKDVLVLFSNKWCGFCQRMELIVREVYRAMRGYINTMKRGSRTGKAMLHGDSLKDVELKFPLIYLLDCTQNDCSLILRSLNQMEAYPALMLFPAEKKNAIPYEGHMGVADVIKFIADHGSNSHHLIYEKGILWYPKMNPRNQNFAGKASSTNINLDTAASNDGFYKVLLGNQEQESVAEHSKLKSDTSKGSHGVASQVVVGSILIAADKLDNTEPFGKSKILIVKVDQSIGFQGLIINKHISWDALSDLEDGLQMLTEAHLCFGGPLIVRGMPLVTLTRAAVEDEHPEVLPGVYYLDQLATYNKIGDIKSGNQSITDYWFFLGYSSWDWDQLFNEIGEGSWDISDDRMTHFHWP
ncbi:uncharacterized protein LOC133824112 [Humulus lupulus]|uniref:uncharacterized protein LOC133824112 n=1 Tax=Humulus lupulus TaxID=3486 RepID=UPI002B418630|nr:uncharacterized protein LOC133824112 [Humulus lupulus]